MLGVTVDTWARDTWGKRTWDEDRAIPEIDEAFAHLRTHARRWPVPADFLAKVCAPPAPQSIERLALEWNRNRGNKSLTAKAHATYCAKLLKSPVPAWCMPDNDCEGEKLLQMIEEIHVEQERQRKERSPDNGKPAGKAAEVLVRDPGGHARVDPPAPQFEDHEWVRSERFALERAMADRETESAGSLDR